MNVFQWLKIGANISNFPMSISAFGFHVCLAGMLSYFVSHFNFSKGLWWLYGSWINNYICNQCLSSLML